VTGLCTLVAGLGAALIASNFAHAQIDGAVQYPPASVGKDAQPPPPAGMVPPIVSPRRIELGVSGSSHSPADYSSRSRLWSDTDRHPMQPAPSPGSSPKSSSSTGGN
jgi:hypothetical protein